MIQMYFLFNDSLVIFVRNLGTYFTTIYFRNGGIYGIAKMD